MTRNYALPTGLMAAVVRQLHRLMRPSHPTISAPDRAAGMKDGKGSYRDLSTCKIDGYRATNAIGRPLFPRDTLSPTCHLATIVGRRQRPLTARGTSPIHGDVTLGFMHILRAC